MIDERWLVPVWRNDDSVVVVKPAGIASEGSPDAALASLASGMRWPEARLPHRLDRITRGFLLVARDAGAVARHNEAVRAKRWLKVYLARLRIDGDPAALLGPHKAFLRRVGRTAAVVRSGGDPSFLSVLAIAPAPQRPGEWHAAIRLDTGRFHQIRAMCAHLGAPLVGDGDYGERTPTAPTLEHAVFSFPTERGRVTLWNDHDPEREPVAAEVLGALSAAAGSAIAMT